MYSSLAGLLIVPWFIHLYVKRHLPHFKWALTGVALGAVIMPATVGVHMLAYHGSMLRGLHPVLWPAVASCEALEYFHNPIPFAIALKIEAISSAKIVVGREYLYLVLIEGAVWSIIYGVTGRALDLFISKRDSHKSK